ncbi:hypothetical protein CP532_1534 [Ophiocordyceps camponoti-leonardi (nom. inval.)]|nr:hypothetical protein CP532_1534 [Ophiocordyceps camponoti-leonardi (nom. inval.)]
MTTTKTMRYILLAILFSPLCYGKHLPSSVKSLYKSITSRERCHKAYATGFHSSEGDKGDFEYCGDHLDSHNVIYIRGTRRSLANMDVDCDGDQQAMTKARDNPCASSTDTQSQTSFNDVVQGYEAGIADLNPHVHPYVVFGNEGNKSNWPVYDPRKQHVKPLSVMAVVCNKKLVPYPIIITGKNWKLTWGQIYGIWGDVNGDDGPEPMIGEASISLAKACFGPSINGNNGHEEDDVLYLAFPGSDAVPGPDAAWNASSYADFARSIEPMGDALVESRIGKASSGSREGIRPPRFLIVAFFLGVHLLPLIVEGDVITQPELNHINRPEIIMS